MNHVFEVIRVNVILMTSRWGDHQEALEIMRHKWRLHFSNTCSDRCLKPV